MRYNLVAVKRDWVPEWLWRLAARCNAAALSVWVPPIGWLLTRAPRDGDLEQ